MRGSWAAVGRVWQRFMDLEPLGASWAVIWAHLFMLIFGTVFKSALGGFWVQSWLDFKGFGRDLSRLDFGGLGGFW